MNEKDSERVAQRVLDEMSRMVLTIGPLLDEVFEGYHDFDDWVMEHLPLQPHTAERVRAMWHLHQWKPNDPELPPAWQALWSMG